LSWYKDTDDKQILSSRVRLARNIDNYNFHRKLDANDAIILVQEVQDAVYQTDCFHFFQEVELDELDDVDKLVYLEKHIISPQFLKGSLPKGVFVSDDKNVSIMINEEDHVRIQSVRPGDDLDYSLKLANQVDDYIEEHLDFAFDAELGYLTACPSNVGTGLRASFMIHLPCLDETELLEKLIPYITKAGMTMRGIYGEGTAPMGSIFQISNQYTLGKSEEEIVQSLKDVTKNIIKHENLARDKMLSKGRSSLQDRVYRAYGVLAYCRKISVTEAMDFLSDIRLGYLTKILELPKPEKQIYQIMMEIQPGHLHRFANKGMSESETDVARAKFLRSIFNESLAGSMPGHK